MINKIKKVFWIVLLVISFNQVQAAGIGVTPAKLYFEQQAGIKKSAYLEVKNLSKEPVIFNLYVDEFEDQIFLEPYNFRLEVGEKQKVKVTLKSEKAGIYATNISVVAQDLDRRKFNVSTGVKVSLEMKISPAPANQFFQILKILTIILLPLIIVAIVVIVIIKRKKRKWYQKLGDSVDLLVHHKKPWWKKLF